MDAARCARAVLFSLVACCAQAVAEGAADAPAWVCGDQSGKVVDEGPPTPLALKIVAYPFKRIGDLAEIFTFKFGFGFGLHGNLHVTRAAQLGAGLAATSRVGVDRGQVGLLNESTKEISLLMLNAESASRHNVLGTFRDYRTENDLPVRDSYHRDYWGVGGEVAFFIPAITLELHPTEAVDAILGIVGVDFRHDDWRSQAVVRPVPLTPATIRAIRRVAIVPSRVIAAPTMCMARKDGPGVYYRRYPKAFAMGLAGVAAGAGEDERAADVLTSSAPAYGDGFDLLSRLLADAERAASVDLRWTVATDSREMLALYRQSAVAKHNQDLVCNRLPNYRGLAEHYGADAVLDVRVWEWGVWRQSLDEKASVSVIVEYKLIKFPENRVLFDWQVVSRDTKKRGVPLEKFLAGGGCDFFRESEEGVGVVSAKLRDLISEAQ
jgi:hypothetical protein